MKKGILLLVLVSAMLTTFGQTAEVYKTMAAETCACIEKRGLDYSKKNDVEMALGLCLLESIQKNKIDVNISDGEAMGELGEKVGLQMAPICPKVFESFIAAAGEDEGEDEVIEITGKVKSIEEKEFLYVNFKEDSGKEHKLLWLRYFNGSDDFVEDPKKLVGKKATITYRNFECYQPKAKIYYNNKEIIDLKLE
jgi:hypothetical protein